MKGTLHRRLGLGDAVALGLGGMVGTGVFVVAGPVAAVAGERVAACLLLAAAVAACNATSAARLAAAMPVSGGAYHWGRELLHPLAGSLAGWCFVVGKTASAAAAALAVGAYARAALGGWAGWQVLVAVVAVLAVTAAVLSGITRTAAASRVLVAGVVAVLVAVAVVGLVRGPRVEQVVTIDWMARAQGPLEVLVGAGLFFLAFAGYARIATLGEEVREPRRTIPLAVAVAFVAALALYALVLAAELRVLGVPVLAGSRAPVLDVALTADAAWLAALVVPAAAAAALAVALGVQAGTSRVLLAMARTGELPAALAVVHPRRGTPWRADVLVGVAVLVLVLVGRLDGAVALSAGTVLVYYAVANAAALRLRLPEGGSPAHHAALRAAAVAGLAGCLVLAAAVLLWAAGAL